MPLPPTAPATTFATGIMAAPINYAATLRGGGHSNGSALFPTNGSVINLPGVWDNAQANNTSALRAIFVVEAATGDNTPVIARFWIDGTYPTTGTGLPIYDGAPVEVNGIANLMNCRLISADGQAHLINVQFFTDQA